jgi:hypothetical protein
VNAEQASKRVMRKPTLLNLGEGRRLQVGMSEAPEGSAGVMAMACMKEEICGNTGNPGGRGVEALNR